MKSLNQVEISAAALRHNFRFCRSAVQAKTRIMAMVKADAYGHGMIDCARILVDEGAYALGVAEVVEGVALRKAGCTVPVYVMAGIIPETAETAAAYDLTPVVGDATSLSALNRAGKKQACHIGVHIKLDAGMGRLGTLPVDFPLLVEKISGFEFLFLEGVLAHFPVADDRESKTTKEVVALFNEAISYLEGRCQHKCIAHLSNSAGLFYEPEAHFDMVRPGISLYGYAPDGHKSVLAGKKDGLRPVMRCTSRVIQVRTVPEGTGLGYSHLYTTRRKTRLALIPVGYEDGYLRILTNKAQVLISGRRASVIGRISMNLTMIDITDLPFVKVNDEVVLLGEQGKERITADEIAEWMGTIHYEVLCLFGRMNNRVLV